MRMFRVVLAAIVAVLLAWAIVPLAGSPASAGSRPERVIDERDPKQVTFDQYKLAGNVTQPVVDPVTAVVTYERYVKDVVKVHRKKCRGCGWKFYKKIKTNKYGTYKYWARVPRRGVWKYRVTIPRSDGYAKTRTPAQALYFR